MLKPGALHCCWTSCAVIINNVRLWKFLYCTFEICLRFENYLAVLLITKMTTAQLCRPIMTGRVARA